MDSKEIREKFGSIIDLNNMRLNPGDMSLISKIGNYLKDLVGEEEVFEYSTPAWSSDGRYIRNTKEVFEFVMINGKFAIIHIVKYFDDDGTTDEFENTIVGGREILNTIKKLMKRSKDIYRMFSD